MQSDPSQYIPPRRRSAIVRHLAEECLIIDTETNHAHCVNDSAARIWQLCDGKTTVASMTARLNQEFESSVDEAFVWMALKKLLRAGLLPRNTAFPNEVVLMTRRKALQKVGGAAALALPFVSSILIPTAAQAASCLHNGRQCVSNSQCCSGICKNLRCSG